MKKINEEKYNEYYKKTYLITITLAIFLFILLLKNMYYSLYNITLNSLMKNEQIIANTIYTIFALVISLTFYNKHKKDTQTKLKKYLKTAGIGLLTIIIYSLTPLIEIAVLYYEKIDIKNMTITGKTIYLIACETMIITIIAILNHKKLEKNIKDIKINFQKYASKYLKIYIQALIIMMISNIIINSLSNQIAGNEEAIRNTLNKAPIYIYFSTVIFAPFAEEMVFRNSINNIITNKKAFVIISGLTFGLLHVIGNINSIYDILYIIPYATPGIAFAYMLKETDNILVSMGIHFLHNSLLMTLQIILLILT
jgi:membrane protease YdiL (CAAX protease family)